MKDNLRRIFWVMCLCLFVLICYTFWLVVFERDTISTNAYNTRLRIEYENLKKGDVLDANGKVIATSTISNDGNYTRTYPTNSIFAHVVGYSEKGKTGLEATQNFKMTTIKNEISQRIYNIMFKDELIGNSISLTIDYELQKLASDLLGSSKGAIVALEPSTGRILTMQAYPTFNPNTIVDDWTNLSNDENSPLINRGTQGLYPPGSTFKIITALSIMRNEKNWENITYNCNGIDQFGDKVITCFDRTAHGEVGLLKAMEKSCNCYFAYMLVNMDDGGEKLYEAMEDSAVLEDFDFQLTRSKNRINIGKDSNESILIETAIGQGETVVTPLYMAMLIGAIANDGIMMEPYLVDNIIDYKGNIKKDTVPSKLTSIATKTETQVIEEMLLSVVENGTGVNSKISGVSVAGKTGTAQNATDFEHSWFVAYAPVENPQIAVAVVIENIIEGGSAVPIARNIIKKYLELN